MKTISRISLTSAITIFALAITPCIAQIPVITLTPGTISTFAGTGTSGAPTSGVGATTSKIGQPLSIAVDASGNVYISEVNGYINEVKASNSYIYTIAGNGTSTYGGDGGAATAAEVNAARGLAADSNGNVYISDSGNNRVRIIYNGGSAAAALISAENPTVTAPVTGDIYTIAGNGNTSGGSASGTLGTSQTLNSPRGLYVDSAGDLYITDQYYVRILYAGGSSAATLIEEETSFASPVAGNMYTVAGTGSNTYNGEGIQAIKAGMNSTSVALDSAGNVYVGGQASNRVQKITLSTGLITTVAGNGILGNIGDTGLSTLAEIDTPRGIAVDAGGNVYIADTLNNCIRKVDASGHINTIAGTNSTTGGYSGDSGNATSATLDQPYDVALDSTGNLYIADLINNRLRKVNVSSATFSFGSTALGATSAGQNATISNAGNATLTLSSITIPSGYKQIVSGGTDCTATTSLSSGLSCTLQLAFNPGSLGSIPGTATVSSNGGSVSIALSGTGITYPSSTTLTTTATSINAGQSITFTAIVTSTSGTPTGTVSFLDGSNNLSTQTLSAGSASFTTSTLNTGTHSITAVYSGNNSISGSISSATLVTVVGYVTTTNISTSTFTPLFGKPVTFSATVQTTGTNPLTGPVSISDNGNLLGVVTLSSGIATLTTSTLVLGKHSIVASYEGDFYNDASSSAAIAFTVAKLQVAVIPGVISTLVDSAGGKGYAGDGGPASLAVINAPFSLQTDSAGNIYVSDTNDTVRMVSATSGNISTIAGISGTASYTGDGGPAIQATINAARGLTMDSNGNIYISDSGNNRVRIIYNGGTVAAQLIVAENSSVATPVVGDIYTIAGNGNTSGGAASGTFATSQTISSPRGLYLDSAGDMYVTDQNFIRVLYAGGSFAAMLIAEETAVTTPVLGKMYTVAGIGGSAYNGEGIQAIKAAINPTSVALDVNGNVYFGDQGTARVQMIQLSSGLVYTVAGNGTAGYIGDGGLGTSAEINTPRALIVDDGGNLYIADTGNNVIRKVDGIGNISTIAGTGTTTGDGGLATSALLSSPYAIAFDNAGNLDIATNGDNRIRSVSAINTSLSFPATQVGSSSAIQTVTIANIGGFSVLPTSISIPVGFTQITGAATDCVSGSSIVSGGSCLLRITSSPAQSGLNNGTLTVSTNATNTSQGIVSVPLSSVGFNPNTLHSTITLATTPAGITGIDLGQTVTLSATVANSGALGIALPTGTVVFESGSTILGTTAVSVVNNNVIATLTLSNLPLGANVITATYNGDTVYQPSISKALTISVYSGPGDFVLSYSGTNNVASVSAGNSALYILNVQSASGFDQPITFSCSNLPANTTCVFSPAILTPLVGESVNFGLTINTAAAPSTAGMKSYNRLWVFASTGICFSLLLCLSFISGRIRRQLRSAIMILLLSIFASGILTGCSNTAIITQVAPSGSSTVNVNAMSGAITHSMNITLTIQ